MTHVPSPKHGVSEPGNRLGHRLVSDAEPRRNDNDPVTQPKLPKTLRSSSDPLVDRRIRCLDQRHLECQAPAVQMREYQNPWGQTARPSSV